MYLYKSKAKITIWLQKHIIKQVIKMKFFKELYEDAKNIQKKDPASRNILEVIILYPRFLYTSISQNITLFI